MGEKEQKKDSEESRENNSSEILIKNIYSKPVLASENDEIYKKIVTTVSVQIACLKTVRSKNSRSSRC